MQHLDAAFEISSSVSTVEVVRIASFFPSHLLKMNLQASQLCISAFLPINEASVSSFDALTCKFHSYPCCFTLCPDYALQRCSAYSRGENWTIIPSPKSLIEKYNTISCKDPEQAFSTKSREPLAEAELLSAILPEETEFIHSSKDLAFSLHFVTGVQKRFASAVKLATSAPVAIHKW